jgi:hypothetical protein
MATGNDIRLDIYVSPETWLALKRVCEQEDRSMSGHIRHLIRRDLESRIAHERGKDCGNDAGEGREDGRGG